MLEIVIMMCVCFLAVVVDGAITRLYDLERIDKNE